MGAKLQTTGPVYVFCGASPQYLGTAEREPRIQIRRRYSPVFNDMGGDTPFDYQYMGEEAFVTVDLNRYDESVYAKIAAQPNGDGSEERGSCKFGDLGTFMIQEARAFPLWLLFPYSQVKPDQGTPPGYHFIETWLEGPDDLPVGTKARKTRLIFHAGRAFSVSPPTGVDFNLYDTDMSGLPPIS